MKKITIIITIALGLFLSACSPQKYDYSSEKAFKASFKVQAEKEGFASKEADKIMEKYIMGLDEATVTKVQAKINPKDENALDKFMLTLLKENVGNKSIKEIQAIVNSR